MKKKQKKRKGKRRRRRKKAKITSLDENIHEAFDTKTSTRSASKMSTRSGSARKFSMNPRMQ